MGAKRKEGAEEKEVVVQGLALDWTPVGAQRLPLYRNIGIRRGTIPRRSLALHSYPGWRGTVCAILLLLLTLVCFQSGDSCVAGSIVISSEDAARSGYGVE